VWAVATSGGAVAIPVLGRQYRGAVQAAPAEASFPALRLVNQIDVEEYLRGMGEVLDASWPPASLRAQAVAARTYALRAMAGAGELCADQRCQVYLGQQVEYPAMDRAVADTAGQVLTFGGRLVSAVYSANGGGTTASREEGFGPNASGWEPGFAYLRVAPYHTRDKFPWSVTIALAAIATRLDYPGVLSSVTVPSVGPSGRALAVSVDGSAGPRVLSGIEFAGALGLRSTLFRLHLEAADDVPSLSVPSPLQLPPEDSAGLQPTMLPTADDGRSSPGGASGSADGSAGQRSKEIGETPGSHGWGPSPGWFSLLPMRPGAPARQRRSAGRRPAGSSSDLRLLGD
jgi:SpoIID/LytB domain protein